MLVALPPILPAEGLHVGSTDDRHVPAESPDSNYGNMLPMLQRLQLTDGCTIRVNPDLPLEQAATDFGDASCPLGWLAVL